MSHALFAQAVYYAAVMHANQKRKGDGLPYDRHCFEVAKILVEHGVDDHCVLAAAVLHDVVEDTKAKFKDIEENFGSLVAFLVRQVTNSRTQTRSEKKQAQLDKVTQANITEEALWIKLADAISNVKDMEELDWSKKRKYGYAAWKLQIAFHTGKNTAYYSAVTQALAFTLDRCAAPYVNEAAKETKKTLKQLCDEYIANA